MKIENFLFGAATAAYQAEGAVNIDDRGKNLWDDFLEKNKNYDPSNASDFYHYYHKDLEQGKKIGLNSIRISIAWSRIFPNNANEFSKSGVLFYHKLIDECLRLKIIPVVTLHHFDSPLWILNKGDFLSREVINDFLIFAKFCFQEYGNKVQKWISFNEIIVYASDKFIIGQAPPCEKFEIGKAIQMVYNMNLAHAKTVLLFKKMKLNGEIGIVHVLQPRYPFDLKKQSDQLAAMRATVFYSQQLLDLNYYGEWSEWTKKVINELLDDNNYCLQLRDEDSKCFKKAVNLTDFLGLNYYAPAWYQSTNEKINLIKFNNSGEKGTSEFIITGIGKSVVPDNIKVNDWDWPIYPMGLFDILLWIKKVYPNYKKIYITENGIGCKETLDNNNFVFDYNRISYLHSHFQAVEKAIRNNVIILGFFVWSWMDMFSWNNGYEKRYGLFFVDYETQQRFPKLSAYWYKTLIKEKSVNKIKITDIVTEYKNNEKS